MGYFFCAVLLLQTVDYIEHYALVRPKNQEGNYMAFKGPHSWDSTSIMTNITLFNLGFHSHHHMKAVVRFEDLIEQETANKMPYGYSIMLLIALVPWVYIPYMNKRLAQIT
ncbi:MAG: fatty acid desaturase [Bdellovibrio sp.]|nr:fatty acid desaturase [Bdellovibrio sp.]